MTFSHRLRATLYAVAGLGAAPLVAGHASRMFRPYIIHGGLTGLLGRIGLWALYYTMIRTVLDLLSDAVDFLSAEYRTEGDPYAKIDYGRQTSPPYDQLRERSVRRDFSSWQYKLFGWTFVELLVGWVAFAAMLFVFFQTPYPAGPGHPFYLSTHANGTEGIAWFLEVYSSFLIYFALYSQGYRWDIGLPPLIQRCLGMPRTYPGQNKFSSSVNELAIRIIGRPM